MKVVEFERQDSDDEDDDDGIAQEKLTMQSYLNLILIHLKKEYLVAEKTYDADELIRFINVPEITCFGFYITDFYLKFMTG